MWPDSDDTQQLLQRAVAGTDGAMNTLLDRHRAALRQVIRARLDRAIARRVDASDVVQDVLLEASRRLADYMQSPKLPFHLWLRQLAKDHVIDMHRRHKVALRRSVDREQHGAAHFGDRSSWDLIAQLRDVELTPAAATIRAELEQRFLAALDLLDEDDRELVLMRHFEHLGNSEVADTLGISPPAASMRYLRALRRLRTFLGEASQSE